MASDFGWMVRKEAERFMSALPVGTTVLAKGDNDPRGAAARFATSDPL